MRNTKTDPRLSMLGERLQTARKIAGLGLNQAAHVAGLSPATLSRIENGHGMLRVDSFLLLCDALGITPSTALRE